jgi:tRNA(fMet)-specific endonuclease VapC
MRIILDTSGYSNFLRGETSLAGTFNIAELIYIPVFVVAELRFGFMLGTKISENEAILKKFLQMRNVALLYPDETTQYQYVEVATFARKSGKELSFHDLWIAALGVQYGATLVTFDKDFQHLDHPKLKLLYN